MRGDLPPDLGNIKDTIYIIDSDINTVEPDSMRGKEPKQIQPVAATVLELMAGSSGHIDHELIGDAMDKDIRTRTNADINPLIIKIAIRIANRCKIGVMRPKLITVKPKQRKKTIGIGITVEGIIGTPKTGKPEPIDDSQNLLIRVFHTISPFLRTTRTFTDLKPTFSLRTNRGVTFPSSMGPAVAVGYFEAGPMGLDAGERIRTRNGLILTRRVQHRDSSRRKDIPC
jgi:hypothetical protein